MLLGKWTIRDNAKKNDDSIVDIKNLNKFMSYMESDIWASINLRYGRLFLIPSIIGSLFYNSLGLFMVFIMVLVVGSYLGTSIINGFKYCKVS